MAGTKLETLPDDVVYAIVAHLPLQDVVRLRQTSKHFQRITHDRVVWADAYRRSSLLRPPGPFPSQPQTELEDILVTTSKVEAAWTSPHPQPVSRRTIPSLKQQSKLRLLYGRWLLIGGPKQELACYDCDASADFGIPVARYPGFICDFACDTAMRSNGNSSLLIAGFQPHRTKKIVILKLNLTSPNPSFERMHAFDGPPGPLTRFPTGRRSFSMKLEGDMLVINDRTYNVVIHLLTFRVYSIPDPEEVRQEAVRIFWHQYLVAGDHLLAVHQAMNCETLWEAFRLPVPDSPDAHKSESVHRLVRTHIGVTAFAPREPAVLRISTGPSDPDIHISVVAIENRVPPDTHDSSLSFVRLTLSSPPPELNAPDPESNAPGPGTITVTKTRDIPYREAHFLEVSAAGGGVGRAVVHSGMRFLQIHALTLRGGEGDEELTLRGGEELTLRAGEELALRGGEELTLRDGEELTLRGEEGGLRGGEELTLSGGEELTLSGGEELTLRGGEELPDEEEELLDEEVVVTRNLFPDVNFESAPHGMVIDGLRGRICMISDTPDRVEVYDYI